MKRNEYCYAQRAHTHTSHSLFSSHSAPIRPVYHRIHTHVSFVLSSLRRSGSNNNNNSNANTHTHARLHIQRPRRRRRHPSIYPSVVFCGSLSSSTLPSFLSPSHYVYTRVYSLAFATFAEYTFVYIICSRSRQQR